MLCWGFVEQARHKHMSDEYKNQYTIYVGHHSGSQRTELKGGGHADKHWPPRYVSYRKNLRK